VHCLHGMNCLASQIACTTCSSQYFLLMYIRNDIFVPSANNIIAVHILMKAYNGLSLKLKDN